MKEPLAPEFAKNRAASLGLFGLAVLALARASALAAASAVAPIAADTNSYVNFDVALYVEIQDMRHMASNPQWMEESWNLISHSMKVEKVWLETYRAGEQTPEADVRKVKAFFAGKGIKTSGGMMAYVGRPGDGLTGFCYSNPDDRERFRKLVAFTAGLFDEMIFDDLFIFDCRCELCQKAKGDLSWTEYRLKVMKEVGENLVVKNAKSVNPKINLIIKPPNWYEQYQFSGYNLEAQSKAFDMIYAGTETRDPENTVMHLQPYQSYGIMRYFEHIKPGKFGGGWVDPGARQTLNRYTEQLEDTLFAKPREITLWSYGNALEALRKADGTTEITSILYADAGDTFQKLDSFLGKLGQPYGVASYKPYHSSGEMYLHNYIGMIGVPMDLYPEFPDDRGTIFLTESAKFDPDLVSNPGHLQGQQSLPAAAAGAGPDEGSVLHPDDSGKLRRPLPPAAGSPFPNPAGHDGGHSCVPGQPGQGLPVHVRQQHLHCEILSAVPFALQHCNQKERSPALRSSIRPRAAGLSEGRHHGI